MFRSRPSLALAAAVRRLWGAGSPGHCCRRLTRNLSPGKVLEASVFSGPSFGRRVKTRQLERVPVRPTRKPQPYHRILPVRHSIPPASGHKKRAPLHEARPDCQKEYLIKIRNAQWVRCQGEGPGRVTGSTQAVLYRALTNWLLVLYRKGRHLVTRGPQHVPGD